MVAGGERSEPLGLGEPRACETMLRMEWKAQLGGADVRWGSSELVYGRRAPNSTLTPRDAPSASERDVVVSHSGSAWRRRDEVGCVDWKVSRLFDA